MNYFIKALIKFGVAFGLFLCVQFLFFQLTFKYSIDLNIDKSKSILILGDSQLQTDLNDTIIEGSINLCKGADVAYFSYIKLKKFKEMNPHLDTLILGFNYDNLHYNGFYDLTLMQERFGNYFYLMEYGDYQDLIKANVKVFLRGFSGMIKNFGNLGFVLNDKEIKNLDLGGFNPRPNDYSKLEPSIQKEIKLENRGKISQIELEYFLKIISFCNQNGIKLIVLNGPIHPIVANLRKSEKDKFLMTLGNTKGDFDYWDFEDFKMVDNLFYDFNHLNHKGANVFSRMINTKLIDSFQEVDN